LLSPVQTVSAAPVRTTQAAPAAPLLQFTSAGHILGFASGSMLAATGSHALHVDFVGANPVQPLSQSTTGQQSNLLNMNESFFKEQPVLQKSETLSQQGIDQRAAPLGQVTYPNLWDGISLDYSAAPDSIYMTTYHISAGANPADIRLHYNTPLTLNPDGSLSITFQTGAMSESAPIAWQEIHGQRVKCAGSV